MNNKPLIIICGPTAVGKSEIAVKLASGIGEIISADSMQIYKYMDIGTSKPDRNLLNKVKHHMIDIITPDRDFSAYQFKIRAEKIINNLYKRNLVPFIVGGTGLYIRALVYGLSDAPGKAPEIRKRLKDIAQRKGINYLFKELEKIDPAYAEKISKNDTVRIIRALEVYEKTGVRFSEFCNKHIKKAKYNSLWIGLNIERKKLYEKIDQRTELMFKNGIVEETEKLIKMGYPEDVIRRRGIGYSDIIDYIHGKISIETAIDNVKKKTRHYAKRQITWFKKEKSINWFRPEQIDQIKELINNRVSDLETCNYRSLIFTPNFQH